jgi:type VI secretion system VgrG family protein
MKFLTEKRFSFISSGLAPETFGVVHFTGTEALSSLYTFDITLVTDTPDLDLHAVLRQPVTFTIHRPNEQRVEFNGILSQFEQLHAFNDCIFYRAQLRPRLWWLTLTHHNQVCLKLPVVPSPQGAVQSSLVGRILIDGGLTPLDVSFRTQKNYPPLDYVCQYDESHYAFIARWLEREGLYYFFEQSAAGEQVVITDSLISHVDLPQEGKLVYMPPSGLDSQHYDEVVKTLICREKMLPQKVLLRDHNYERPTLEVAGTATVDPQGRGETYVYGEHFQTPEEGNRLATIHAESLLCRQREFFGESTVPFMMPGFTFSLANHYRRDFNRRYLVCEVLHEGNQTGYLVSGLQGALADVERAVSYRNSFIAIPAEVQFRPERVTTKPRISGTLHATVDAEGSGEYAELDDQGRYKVRLPFDINSEHGAGKASCFLRMAQPYAGPRRGMHFPLPKGTEVLLTFIGGDPDRPVIAAAVPNPETPSPSTARNQTESVIQTGGDNTIRIEDKKGSERIIMQSPTADSWVRIGAPNDPPTIPEKIIPTVPIRKPDHGIRLHTKHDFWCEAHQRYGEYRCGFNDNAPEGTLSGAPKTGTLLKNFSETYTPKGMLGRHSKVAQTWEEVLAHGHVQVSSLDTITTQEGNIYDFGGFWNYNLGNCYVENHINQQATLNAKQEKELLDIGGPNFTSLSFPELPSGADASLDGTWPPSDGMWVEKKVGNSYDYVKGDAVSVTVGSSLGVNHGGRHVEVKYRGDGSLAAWSWSEGGVSKEKKWTQSGICILDATSNSNTAVSEETINDRDSGALALYTTTKNMGRRLASYSFSMAAKATSEINLAAVAAFSLSAAAKVHLEFSVAASAKIGIGAALEFEMWWNPSGKLQLKNSKFEYHGIGSKLDKEEAVKAEIKNLYIENKLGWIKKDDFEAAEKSLTVKVQKLGLDSGIFMGGF